MRSVGQNSTFPEHVNVAYQINEIQECSNMVANILPADLPQTLGIRSVGQNSTFSEHVNVAYQINENQECSHMVANILTADPPPPPPPPDTRMGSKYINLKGISKCSSMVANILLADPYPPPPPDPRVGSIDLNSTFSEHGLVAYQIKENHKLKRITNAATW